MKIINILEERTGEAYVLKRECSNCSNCYEFCSSKTLPNGELEIPYISTLSSVAASISYEKHLKKNIYMGMNCYKKSKFQKISNKFYSEETLECNESCKEQLENTCSIFMYNIIEIFFGLIPNDNIFLIFQFLFGN